MSRKCCCAADRPGQTRIPPTDGGMTSQKAEQDAAVRQRVSSLLRVNQREDEDEEDV